MGARAAGRAACAGAVGPAPERPSLQLLQIIAGELPGQIVDSDDRTISFIDISPATRGHALVIPRYQDDPLRLPWKPQPGDSDEIAAAAEQLR